MSNFCPATRGAFFFFLGSLVQLCFGEGGTLWTSITALCSRWFSHTGFAPAHGMCAFPVYTAQTPGCSARNCLMRALVYVHFPGLSRSGSGSQVLHKGADLAGPAFCTRPRPKQLRWPGAWPTYSPPVGGCSWPPHPFQLPGFLGVQRACLLKCVSILGSWSLAATLPENVDRPESQEVLVSREVCLQFCIGCLSGAECSLPALAALACLSPVGGWWVGPQQDASVRSWLALLSPLFWVCLAVS